MVFVGALHGNWANIVRIKGRSTLRSLGTMFRLLGTLARSSVCLILG